MSGCGFVKIPTITTSLEGSVYHDRAVGGSSVYSATTSGFTVNIQHLDSSYNTGTRLSDAARNYKWNLEWVAVGYTC